MALYARWLWVIGAEVDFVGTSIGGARQRPFGFQQAGVLFKTRPHLGQDARWIRMLVPWQILPIRLEVWRGLLNDTDVGWAVSDFSPFLLQALRIGARWNH